jgi:hypothetical protein
MASDETIKLRSRCLLAQRRVCECVWGKKLYAKLWESHDESTIRFAAPMTTTSVRTICILKK